MRIIDRPSSCTLAKVGEIRTIGGKCIQNSMRQLMSTDIQPHLSLGLFLKCNNECCFLWQSIKFKLNFADKPYVNSASDSSCCMEKDINRRQTCMRKSKNKRKRCRNERAEGDVKSCKNAPCGGLIYKAYAWSSQRKTSKADRMSSRKSGKDTRTRFSQKIEEKKEDFSQQDVLFIKKSIVSASVSVIY